LVFFISASRPTKMVMNICNPKDNKWSLIKKKKSYEPELLLCLLQCSSIVVETIIRTPGTLRMVWQK
jgi:hypothetical protein